MHESVACQPAPLSKAAATAALSAEALAKGELQDAADIVCLYSAEICDRHHRHTDPRGGKFRWIPAKMGKAAGLRDIPS